jgi:hypothetical protein
MLGKDVIEQLGAIAAGITVDTVTAQAPRSSGRPMRSSGVT